MSALTFTLRKPPAARIDLRPLTPHRLADLSAEAVKAVTIHVGNERASVDDLFRVKGNDANDIRIVGATERCDFVGHEMAGGAIAVDGDVGVEAGRRMRGGLLTISGDAGPWAGSQMAGGRLEIGGDAGDRLGGPLQGELQGMAGGLIVVSGSAGERAGERMRRGVIVVRKNAGGYAGYRMIAGTLVVLGKAGALPGYMMGRGTIILGKGTSAMSPTFADCGLQELAVLGLLGRSLAENTVDTGTLLRKPLCRHAGDLAALGKGEIFTPA